MPFKIIPMSDSWDFLPFYIFFTMTDGTGNTECGSDASAWNWQTQNTEANRFDYFTLWAENICCV
jgi:hypothetical protein